LVPMRPVTPFMMMPIRCVFIGCGGWKKCVVIRDAA